ncbi:metallo-beta-lactamase domain [Moniliophthora roreri]|nr:metallo-beta-lactamase domain [Moniliophthora roreri]
MSFLRQIFFTASLPVCNRRLISSLIEPTKPSKIFRADGPGAPDIYSFFEKQTSSWQHLLVDPKTSESVIIDPVLDYNPASGTVSMETADGLLDFAEQQGLKISRVLFVETLFLARRHADYLSSETHAHADHLSASQYYKKTLGNISVCIGHRITQVQSYFAPRYGFGPKDMEKAFDQYLKDDEEFTFGSISGKVVHLPGHTPVWNLHFLTYSYLQSLTYCLLTTQDHIGYIVGRNVFVGDSLFMPDLGSARVDFPGGNAKDLFNSITRLLSLPDDYRIFVGHDYPSNREEDCIATVGNHKELNKHCKVGTTEQQFIEFREARDNVLGAPRLLHPSLQVNIRAGRLPPVDGAGRILMKIPVRIANQK